MIVSPLLRIILSIVKQYSQQPEYHGYGNDNRTICAGTSIIPNITADINRVTEIDPNNQELQR